MRPALLVACAGFVSPLQAGPARGDELARLTLDELIARMPQVAEDAAVTEFETRIERGDPLTAEQWKHALLGTGALRIRERWPVEEPFALSMRVPEWLTATRLRLEPEVAGLRAAEIYTEMGGGCGTCLVWEMRAADYQVLGRVPAGPHLAAFTATFERDEFRSTRVWDSDPPDPPHPPGGVFWRGTLTFPVEIVASLDEAIPPVKSPEIDAAVRRSLGLTADGWLVVDPDLCDPRLAELGLSLSIDVLEDGEPRGSLQLIPSDDDIVSACVHDTAERPIAFAPIATPRDDVASGALATADTRRHWSLRVHGTSDGVLHLWYAKERWSGELTVSFDELLQREHEVAPHGREFFWTPNAR